MGLIYRIKSFLSDMAEKSHFGSFLYYHGKYALAKLMRLILGEVGYAKWFYRLYTGKELNLDNPQLFDEKLWWLKLNNRDPLMTICSDKAAVRDYVSTCGFTQQLIPQFGLFSDPIAIPFQDYTEEIVTKCTHNSGGHFFYNPQKPLKQSERNAAVRRMRYILNQDASVLSLEWNYKHIKPQITVEKVIRDKNGYLPLDYKFLCFNGEPKLLFLDFGVISEDMTYNHKYPRNIYDMEFNLLPVYETRPNASYDVKKPDNFDFMVRMAGKLSEPFVFCRVDLYNVDGQVYFGEITFFHGGGCNKIMPNEWDIKMGSWIDLNSPKIVRKCI